MLRPARHARRAASLGLAATLLGAALAGCSGGDDDAPEAAPSSATPSAPAVTTNALVGVVTGALGRTREQQTRDATTAVVDGWLDAAYLDGDYPRDAFDDAFPGFTARAAALAGADPSVLSNAALGPRLDDVTAVRRTMKVDVLARRGVATAVTVRLALTMDLAGDGVDRRDRVQGRVFLTRVNGDWKIFGFDLDRKQTS